MFKQLGDVLVDEGLITSIDLREALEEQRLGRPLGSVLIDKGLISESALVRALAKRLGLPFVDLSEHQIDPSAAASIPETLARRYQALPIGYDEGRVVVAMSDPTNVLALDDIRSLTGLPLKPVIATTSDILAAIGTTGRLEGAVESLSADLQEQAGREAEDAAAVQQIVDEAPIVKFVNLLITQAVQQRASDIHIEPQERDLRIRYRIDGVLHEMMRSHKAIQSGVLSRIKIMAEMDIAERRIPQDGRVGLMVDTKPVDLRVASLPTVYGEKLVLRILDKSTILLRLEDLGFSDHNFRRFESAYAKPYGMILVTGPTGSGKSTTLYATLNILNRADRNIITVEDPVEYRLPGVNQIQTNNRAGLTFASALRSILRADPDIVLIGEVRDRETAQIAIEAALTGHLVLTTLHTNDAPSAITRLIEMGIEPFLVSSAMDAVLAQRLARRLCAHCKEPYTPTREALVENGVLLGDGEEPPTLFRAVGCSHCSKTGYRGRVALHEVMLASEAIERLAVERRSSDEIKRAAVGQGMVLLRDDGIAKVKAGVTSMEEVQRVVL
ncbi:MAG: GspE/PulE family protein [Actinomycetota bacterium]